MFNRKTVFILGAGASWHYGYPLGERLVDDVIGEAHSLAEFYKTFAGYGAFMTEHVTAIQKSGADVARAYPLAREECLDLAKRLTELNPPVIDYFLGHNPELRGIGGMLTALVILKADASLSHTRRNKNRPAENESLEKKFRTQDDWCRFLNYHLAIGCRNGGDLLKNKVSFITFNYDMSLEREIYNGLRSIEMFRTSGVVQDFLASRITHIYGTAGSWKNNTLAVVDRPSKGSDSRTEIIPYVDMINVAYRTASQIKTMSDDKDGNEKEIAAAKTELASAECVFVLGYGFDPQNSERIDLGLLNRARRPGLAQVSFTNFRDGDKINKRASLLLTGTPGRFLSHDTPFFDVYEKSVRDVYGALSMDFEFP